MIATALSPRLEVSERELGFLNFYRASELHGGLILAQVARRTRDGALSTDLLRTERAPYRPDRRYFRVAEFR